MSAPRMPWAVRALAAVVRWFPVSWLFLLVGRARLREVARDSLSLAPDPTSPLVRRVQELAAGHGTDSGLALLEDGAEALMVRCALADAAHASLDLQYYAYAHDSAGRLLLERLWAAAERGVRVRILIDDTHLGAAERHLVDLDAHPRIEVRSFNPVAVRRGLARVLRFLMDAERLHRRMHDKLFVADGVTAVIGGRNVGDAYFGASAESFHDLDLLLVGPAVADAQAGFDAAWTSAHAVPIAAFRARDPDPARAARRVARLVRRAQRRTPDLAERYARARVALERWADGGAVLAWAPARVLVEPPERIDGTQPPVIAPALAAVLDAARSEVLIESAYLVPDAALIARLCALTARGVRVKVLTNSLASTDVPAVHAGYAPQRARLVAAGVEVHEFRARRRDLTTLWRRATEETVLHAKALVVDRRVAWVGSANLDPRSAWFNTEVGVLVASEVIAVQLARHILHDCEPARAWRVATAAEGGLDWTGEVAGRQVRWTDEPEAGPGRRLLVALVGLVPGHADVL